MSGASPAARSAAAQRERVQDRPAAPRLIPEKPVPLPAWRGSLTRAHEGVRMAGRKQTAGGVPLSKLLFGLAGAEPSLKVAPERVADRMFKVLVRKIRASAAERGIDFVVATRMYLDDREPYPLWAGLTPDKYEAHLLDRLRVEWYEDLIESLWGDVVKSGNVRRKQVAAGLVTGARKKEKALERQLAIIQSLHRLITEGKSRNLAKLVAKELCSKSTISSGGVN
jgi:hypothetical protein